MVYTKTLYNYVNFGLLPIINTDLFEKFSSNTNESEKTRKSLEKTLRNVLKKSNFMRNFSHWEIHSVLSLKKY
jgi:hypothetical protein